MLHPECEHKDELDDSLEKPNLPDAWVSWVTELEAVGRCSHIVEEVFEVDESVGFSDAVLDDLEIL